IPLKAYLANILPDASVVPPPPITALTLEIGAKHSPESVCLPFKYNLGNFIQALENGADILMCAGGGCRYGLYGEVHEQILKELGYSDDQLKELHKAGVYNTWDDVKDYVMKQA
ncbi:MAG: hypothetical protein FWG32_09870, partial [Oscillospiraceae bacterium]|nr:hypothetical protein [Oscillospiraceae bacterium]